MIIGTAGHIDHGKTALVRALTGIDTDRLPAEKARGITIDLGFAYRRLTTGATLGFVDVPGHEALVHTMLAGAAGIDCVLLVVAADDGPMPQTREHLDIIHLLGIKRGIIALTKCDRVGYERIAALRTELRSLVAPTTLAGAEIIAVSATTGDGLSVLEAWLCEAASSPSPDRRGGRFRLAVDRSFSLPGIGTVVSGAVFAGTARVGDKIVVSPSGLAARVRTIHAENAPAQEARERQRCALNLVGAGIEKDRIRRGDWIVDEGLHAPTDRFDARIRLLPSERQPLRDGITLHLHLGAARASARVILLDRGRLLPGHEGFARLAPDRALGALHGDRIVLRDPSARRTIGGGIVVEPWPPKRGSRRPQRLTALTAAAWADPRQALLEMLSGARGWADLTRFALARNLTAETAAELWRLPEIVRLEAGAGRYGFGHEFWRALVREVRTAIADHHQRAPDSPGIEAHRLRVALGLALPLEVFSAALAAMASQGEISRDGAWFKLAGHAVQLTPADQRLWQCVGAAIDRVAFAPPRVRDLARKLRVPEDAVRQVLRRLSRTGELIEIACDRFYRRAAVTELATIAARLASDSGVGRISAAVFRDHIGTGRKLAIEILEHFDRAGITVREGDLRRTNEDQLAKFVNRACR
jgi:selenocysteine-specific elongation factor